MAKIFPVPSASEKHLNRPKFSYPFGVIVTDIAKIMLFLAILTNCTQNTALFSHVYPLTSPGIGFKRKGVYF